MATPPIPTPPDPDLTARWEYTRRARRLLYGKQREDVVRRLQEQIDHVRRAAWGTVDLTANLYRSVWDSLATLYVRPPSVSHEDDADVAGLVDAVQKVGLWSLMIRVQRDTLGLREMLVRADVAAERVVYRPVYPDLVEVTAYEDRPTVPREIREMRLRTINGKPRWCWDVLSLDEMGAPVYRIEAATKAEGEGERRDLSPLLLSTDDAPAPDGGLRGDLYPYVDSSGAPFLPYAIYHAAETSGMWDPYTTQELVEGTLQLAVMYTFLGHVVRSACWRQRYGIDVEPLGAELAEPAGGDGSRRDRVVTDPATVAMFQARRSSADGAVSPSVGQFEVPLQPSEMMETIERYERRLVSMAGINPADQMRMSGDPRSGYAVSVSRDAQREAQRRYEPLFQRADSELLAITAKLLNLETGSAYPEQGYRVHYQGVPQSAQEREAERVEILALLEAGLTDRVSAYQQLHPGISKAEALRDLRMIEATNRSFAPAEEPEPQGAQGATRAEEPEPRPTADEQGLDEGVETLNGAQVASALEIIGKVVTGDLTAAMAEAMLVQFLGIRPEIARKILADIGKVKPPTEAAPSVGGTA